MFPSIKKLKEDSAPSAPRLWYNDWIKKNARGSVLDVGKSTFWEYGFPTVDINEELSPTFTQDICDCKFFADNLYDMVLCNGLYESVESPQKMVNEVMRITKKLAIFGFVNESYRPYKKPWKFYKEGDIEFPGNIIKTKLFNNYVFIICRK